MQSHDYLDVWNLSLPRVPLDSTDIDQFTQYARIVFARPGFSRSESQVHHFIAVYRFPERR
ncbi:MAG: hypothetical protein QF909_10795 [SAR202 cluster bacterium]|nr:hypothetical protein [SAR202 cluster bacterium]MDP7414608.1 hypothetical protein [SAR202 cluster bacterium]